jgi:hypothetical protein
VSCWTLAAQPVRSRQLCSDEIERCCRSTAEAAGGVTVAAGADEGATIRSHSARQQAFIQQTDSCCRPPREGHRRSRPNQSTWWYKTWYEHKCHPETVCVTLPVSSRWQQSTLLHIAGAGRRRLHWHWGGNGLCCARPLRYFDTVCGSVASARFQGVAARAGRQPSRNSGHRGARRPKTRTVVLGVIETSATSEDRGGQTTSGECANSSCF